MGRGPAVRHCAACQRDTEDRTCPKCGGRTIIVLGAKPAAEGELDGIAAGTRPLATGPRVRSKSRLGFGAKAGVAAAAVAPLEDDDCPPTMKIDAVAAPAGLDWDETPTIPPFSDNGLEVLPPLPALRPKPPPAKKAPTEGEAGTRLDFELTLSGCRNDAPAARVWVDANRDGQMDAEEEIRPLQRERLTWRGTYQLPGDTSRQIGFRVLVEASVGCRWRLRVWSDRPRRHMVYEQVDRMQRATERVIGWCEG